MATSKLQELINRQEELQRQIREVQESERTEAIAKVRQIMSESGLTLADLGGKSNAASKSRNGGTGVKAPIKFRDPDSGSTWSGRGLKPRWLTQKMALGASKESFAV